LVEAYLELWVRAVWGVFVFCASREEIIVELKAGTE